VQLAQPGHWLGPVTGPGWLGPARPMWAVLGLGPAPKKKKKNRKCRNKNFACLRKNVFLSIYSLISGSGIKKENILIFFS